MIASPFHAGERALQAQTGWRERMEAMGPRVIRDHMPDQHREFFTQLPFLVVGSLDAELQPWASVLAAPGAGMGVACIGTKPGKASMRASHARKCG